MEKMKIIEIMLITAIFFPELAKGIKDKKSAEYEEENKKQGKE